jgi:hypothetical protein
MMMGCIYSNKKPAKRAIDALVAGAGCHQPQDGDAKYSHFLASYLHI